MLLRSLPLLLLLLLLTAAAASSSSSSNGTTVYDLLQKFGLPPGLLPDSVTSFSLSSDGEFEVELEAPCYAQFEYLVYYDQKVSGVVKIGGIHRLEGIHVRRLLIWFDVDAIKVDLPPSEYIYFQVGWITKKLAVDQFRTVHSCLENHLLLDHLREAAGRMIQIPEPVREISMLITD